MRTSDDWKEATSKWHTTSPLSLVMTTSFFPSINHAVSNNTHVAGRTRGPTENTRVLVTSQTLDSTHRTSQPVGVISMVIRWRCNSYNTNLRSWRLAWSVLKGWLRCIIDCNREQGAEEKGQSTAALHRQVHLNGEIVEITSVWWIMLI